MFRGILSRSFFQKMFLSGLEWEKGLEAQRDHSHLQSHLLNDA